MMESQHKAEVVVEQKKDAIFVLGRKRMVTMRQSGAELDRMKQYGWQIVDNNTVNTE